MINLEKINPFSYEMMYSLCCFQDENIFYDCVNHNVLEYDYFMDNLGYSFHTYMVTDYTHKWIGYVLFHNKKTVDEYVSNININAYSLLTKIEDKTEGKKIKKLAERIRKGEFSILKKILELNDLMIELNSELNTNESIDKNKDLLINEYNEKNNNFISNLREVYEIDATLALPLTTIKDNDMIESSYSEFITDLYDKINEKIEEDFKDADFVVRRENRLFTVKNSARPKEKVLVNKIDISTKIA